MSKKNIVMQYIISYFVCMRMYKNENVCIAMQYTRLVSY